MAQFFISPSVKVSEVDNTLTANALPTNIAGYAGYFSKGQLMKPIYVGSDKTFEAMFGTPTADNAEHWYSIWNFLQYGGQLYVVNTRGDDSRNSILNLKLGTTDFDKIISYHTYTWSTDKYVVTAVQGVPTVGTIAMSEIERADLSKYIFDGSLPTTTDGEKRLVISEAYIPNEDFLGIYEPPTGTKFSFISKNIGDYGDDLSIVISGVNGKEKTIYNTTPVTTEPSFIDASFKKPIKDYFDSDVTTTDYVYIFLVRKTDVTAEYATDIIRPVYEILEKFLVSLVRGTKDLDGNSVYIDDVINRKSGYMYSIYDDSGTNAITYTKVFGIEYDDLYFNYEAWSASATDYVKDTVVEKEGKLYKCTSEVADACEGAWDATKWSEVTTVTYSTTELVNRTTMDGGIEVAPTSSDIIKGYELFKNPSEMDVNLLFDGANSAFPNVQMYLNNVAEYRKDVVAITSLPDLNTLATLLDDEAQKSGTTSWYTRLIKGRDVREKKYNITDAIIAYRSGKDISGSSSTIEVPNTLSGINSSYCAFYGNRKIQYDSYNDRYINVSVAGDVAGVFVRTDNTLSSWYAPAGYQRGGILNASDLLYSPSEEFCDLLTKNQVNSIIKSKDGSIIILDQLTMLSAQSKFRYIDIRRLFITIEKHLANYSRYFLQEKNDTITAGRFESFIRKYLNSIKSRRGIDSFEIAVSRDDENDLLIATIDIVPIGSVRGVHLIFRANKNTASFEEQ